MNKQEYIDALKRAMAGLPPELVAKTLAYYEQRFIDGLGAGLSETEIAADLDEPRKIAMTLRANTHMSAFEQKRNPVNLLRLLFSALGLAIFNLFMVVPAIVYSSLLAALYAVALASYFAGIVVTAGGLSGANELVFDGPMHQLVSDDDVAADASRTQTHVLIGESGIRVFEDAAPQDSARTPSASAKPASASATAHASGADPGAVQAGSATPHATVAPGVHISTDLDNGSRTIESFFGLGFVLAGIALFLVSLVVTRYTFVGLRRYVEMNISLLKGS
jgi:uncharacterized membrane protein